MKNMVLMVMLTMRLVMVTLMGIGCEINRACT